MCLIVFKINSLEFSPEYPFCKTGTIKLVQCLHVGQKTEELLNGGGGNVSLGKNVL